MTNRNIANAVLDLFSFAVAVVSHVALLCGCDVDGDNVKTGGSKAKKKPNPPSSSVMTEDRISIQKRVVDECREAVLKQEGGATLTKSQKREILRLRKSGLAIKAIARQIHRRDRTVSAFLASV